MNHGRREIGVACVVALIAWAVTVHYLPLLRFLVYAFQVGLLAGLVSIAVVFITIVRPPSNSTNLSSTSAAVSSPAVWSKDKSYFLNAQRYEPVQLYPESFVVSQALDNLVAHILRAFVSSWYINISTSRVFVNEVDREIRGALLKISDRLRSEDLSNLLVSRIVPAITLHLKNFDAAEKTVRGKSLNRNVTESEELDLAVAGKYKDGRLHPAASLAFSDTKVIQQDHLRKTLVRIMPDIVSDHALRSRAVSVLLKEIIACGVLYPVLQMLADPDTWNQLVEAYGRTALQDRKTVKRMRAALDEHASPSPKRQALPELPRLSANDSERAFEKFVRAVRKVKTLSDARRYRNSIASQLAKATTVEGQDPVYLRRLEMAKRVLDQKISRFNNGGTAVSHNIDHGDSREETTVKVRDLSLPEILHMVSGLSSFMEFMDRQKRMSLVQFWIVVDGFRNPLEDDFGEDGVSGVNETWTDTDRLDIAQISEVYITKPEIHVPQESQDAIQSFLMAGRQATAQQYKAARIAILSAQSTVLEELESKYLPSFRRSDLYFSFLASDEANAKGLRMHAGLDDNTVTPASTGLVTTPMIRSISQQPLPKQTDLRRAALSSSDVKSLVATRPGIMKTSARKSIDSDDRPPLFDDGYDTDPLAHSSHSIDHDSGQGESNNNAHDDQMIENMEAVLTDIMSEKPQLDPFVDEPDREPDSETVEPQVPKSEVSAQAPLFMRHLTSSKSEKLKPSLATLGLVNTASRIGVFSDNDLFSDEEKFPEDEYADPGDDKAHPEDEIHAAAPGDLGLAEAIAILTNDIERLISQESVVDALTRKAELTNNVAELRILGKSKASLQREIRRKELQRQQYIVQESDNSLYGRSSIRIKSVMVGKEEDGHEFALYMIEVQRQAGDQMPAAVWAIARRYSEFHDLHQKLRRSYPSTRHLEFPRRRMVMKLQKQFLQNRRSALEVYLQQLLRMPDVCRSLELRSFLSQQAIHSENGASHSSDTQDLVTRIYNSVTDGMDEFLGNIAVLDQLSVAGQNLISAATGQATGGASQADVITIEPGSIAEAEAELRAFEDKELEPFVKPICDIFLEIFELNRGNNWLRGRAVVVVLHQLLGGTVERKIRDALRGLMQEETLTRYIDQIKNAIGSTEIPRQDDDDDDVDNNDDDGPVVGKKPSQPRTPAQKERTRKEAGIMLASLVPDLAGSVVGRSNAQVAARKVMATLNNKRLNEHLVMTIFDEIIGVLFKTNMSTSRVGV